MIKSSILRNDLEECFKIRYDVFVEEQGLDPDVEIDEIDNSALHILVYSDDKAVATARFFTVDDYWKIGRLCVLKEFRELKLGSYILTEIEKEIKKLNGKLIYLSAQYQTKKFYEKNGYISIGEIYYEEGLKHIKMKKLVE